MRKLWAVLLMMSSLIATTAVTASAESLYVKAGSYVHHDKNNDKYTEGFDNNAIAVEYEFKQDGHLVWSVSAQHNTNSYGKESVSVYAVGKACTTAETRACAGVAGGGATGYKQQSGMTVTPFGGLTFSVEHGKVGLDLLVVPSVGKIDGFKAGILKYKVQEW